MRFPSIGELATTSLETISTEATLRDAVSKMLTGNHRNIIITCKTSFCIINVHDILRVNHSKTDLSQSLECLQLPQLPTIKKDTNILESLEFLKNDIEHIAVLNDDGSLYGIVAHSDIISSIDPDTLMDNYRLCDFVKVNKSNRWVRPHERTYDVLSDMQRYNHDAALVVENQLPLGILTTKDILRLLQQNSDLNLPISHHMVSPVITIHNEKTINDALRFMKHQNFKRIVTVDDNGKLAGVITQKELISITFSRWVVMMKEYQQELKEINRLLEKKSQKYEKIAATDPLTGLYNRMKFIELYISEYTVMTQRHNAMSLLIIDIDHFKRINDTYGHNTGDDALRALSDILLHVLRNVDVLCRWGGEEFVALLPTAEAQKATAIAEKIRLTVAEQNLEKIPAMTVSIGVTEIREGDTLDEAINRADQALYQAKNTGRNRISIL